MQRTLISFPPMDLRGTTPAQNLLETLCFGKQLILVDSSQAITKIEIEIPLWKDGTHHSDGFCWDLRDRLGLH